MSAAMHDLVRMGVEARTKVLALQSGVEWQSLDLSAREGLIKKAYNKKRRKGMATVMKKRTDATEACARKIAQSEGRDWDSTWTLTQECDRDEVETVCHKCYVRGSKPQTRKDAFHILLTGVVLHWMGEDIWGNWTVDRQPGSKYGPPPGPDMC